jgi:uncharacterized Zn finger protein
MSTRTEDRHCPNCVANTEQQGEPVVDTHGCTHPGVLRRCTECGKGTP